MTGAAWSSHEIDVLRATSRLGINACCRALPGRSRHAIHRKAAGAGIAISLTYGGDRNGTRWRGRIAVPGRCHPIVRFFYEETNRQRALISEVTAKAGIDRDAPRHWSKHTNPRIDDIIAALNVLGFTLVVMPLRDPPSTNGRGLETGSRP